MNSHSRQALFAAALALLVAVPAQATWSIIIVNRVTKEVAVGSATCLQRTNLVRLTPVVRVGLGAAAAQAAVESTGRNRTLIWREFRNGTDPLLILQLLDDQDSAHQTRQYGIVDTRGRAATFSGRRNGAYANGLTGQIGDLSYAIQGNVITGQPVLDMAERAVRETPGGIPEKLMAAMEAARSMGGDGRCSCDPAAPDSCGSPPPDFTRSAFVGYMIAARRGDTGRCRNGSTCDSAEFYLKLNVQNPPNSDPVPRLHAQFDQWRASLIGVPDAVESRVSFSTRGVLNDDVSTATVRVELLDFQGAPATDATGVTITHDSDSGDGPAVIGPLTSLGNGVYEGLLTAGTTAGVDRLMIIATSPGAGGDPAPDREVVLMPSPRFYVQDRRADLNSDGAVDLADLAILLQSFGTDDAGDIDGDSDTDLSDLGILLSGIVPA